MSWSDGYVTELNYNFGYYHELNPLRVATALTGLGLDAPKIRNACELGFGQGVSAAFHAAAQPDITWWGTDFNPAQAGFAQQLARDSGADGRFFDQSFQEFCDREDLPEFEFIGLHGIWSWISDANRRVIVDVLRRKLAVGGVLFMSYNTQPGWAIGAPLREILKEQGDRVNASMPMAQRIDNALAFADQLLAIKPLFARLNPTVQEKLEALKGHPREYLAHEYMNRDWRPMYFSEVAGWLEDAKVTFAGSAAAIEQQDPLNMTPEQMVFLQGISDPVFRETTRDFIINQQFRRDLWVRGPRKLTPLEHAEAHGQIRYILVSAKADISPHVAGKQGDVTMNAAIYDPIIEAMADHQPRTAAQIQQAVAAAGISLPQLLSALGVLRGTGALAVIQSDNATKAARPFTDKLNHALQLRARSSNDIGFLVSPVLGGGVPVNRFDQLFLLARRQGQRTVAEWAQFVAGLLAAQGHQVTKEGKILTTPEESLAELLETATSFHDKRLPIYTLLGIV